MAEKGSFIGFTYGNRHSSQLGILRTSDSDRFSVELTPTVKDLTYGHEKTEGVLYVGSEYTRKILPISFAFYGLLEEQIKDLKNTFNAKDIKQLIFDEDPYKIWYAKPTTVSIMKHVCLTDKDKRFYCGTGTIEFTAYYPYAKSRYEYIEDYTEENIDEWSDYEIIFRGENGQNAIYPAILSYGLLDQSAEKIVGWEDGFNEWLQNTSLLTNSPLDMYNVNSCVTYFKEGSLGPYSNLEEWRIASGIPSREQYGGYSDGCYKLFNAGDIDMPFKLYLKINKTPKNFIIACGHKKLSLENVISLGTDFYIVIDTLEKTVCGSDQQYKKTKNLYNEKITEGDFFDLSVGENILETEEGFLEFKYLYL